MPLPPSVARAQGHWWCPALSPAHTHTVLPSAHHTRTLSCPLPTTHAQTHTRSTVTVSSLSSKNPTPRGKLLEKLSSFFLLYLSDCIFLTLWWRYCPLCFRRGIHGMFPLHLAALSGFSDCCRKLLSSGEWNLHRQIILFYGSPKLPSILLLQNYIQLHPSMDHLLTPLRSCISLVTC